MKKTPKIIFMKQGRQCIYAYSMYCIMYEWINKKGGLKGNILNWEGTNNMRQNTRQKKINPFTKYVDHNGYKSAAAFMLPNKRISIGP